MSRELAAQLQYHVRRSRGCSERREMTLRARPLGSNAGRALAENRRDETSAQQPAFGKLLRRRVGHADLFLMEQFLSWHHAHSPEDPVKQPVTYLILLADGVHNFIGGLALGASFLISIEVGSITWIAAAAHEIPQDLGDFAILIRGGWSKLAALVANFVSAATIIPGALLAYSACR